MLTKTVILNAIVPGRNQLTVQADEDHAGIVVSNTTHRSPLPPLQLPKFSGNTLEWKTYKEMFVALVHNVPTIPTILKTKFST